MLSQIGHLLIQTVFGVFVYALLLRFYMQWLRAPFRNPVGQFVSALTDWIVGPRDASFRACSAWICRASSSPGSPRR